MSGISRRNLLKGSAVIGGASLMSFSQALGYTNLFAQDNGDDIPTILNLAATAETFACTHYYRVLTESNIALDPGEISMLKGFLDAELQHLDYLNANGGQTLVTEFYAPENVYQDRQQFADITEQAETIFIGAYLAGLRRFAELGNPALALTAGQVAAVEQEHLALVRGIGGRRPNNVSLARTPFFNVSDAVPLLQPFLEGGAGFDGPVAFPGADALRDIIRDDGVIPVLPATDPAAFTISNEQAATGVPCTITPSGNFNVNIRSTPSLGTNIAGTLLPGNSLDVDGQTTDSNSFVWWHLTNGSGWIRSDVVTETGDCGTTPTMSA
ncbi:MAG: ferritin-like domain-containing protein [Burkholderiales bacterium]|nr:ferritin-like domain-containing protein [Anaerolineae bacterium]